MLCMSNLLFFFTIVSFFWHQLMDVRSFKVGMRLILRETVSFGDASNGLCFHLLAMFREVFVFR